MVENKLLKKRRDSDSAPSTINMYLQHSITFHVKFFHFYLIRTSVWECEAPGHRRGTGVSTSFISYSPYEGLNLANLQVGRTIGGSLRIVCLMYSRTNGEMLLEFSFFPPFYQTK